MHWTIKQKLYGLGGLGLLFTAAIGIFGYRDIATVAKGIASVAETSAAMKSHLEAGMFLDLTRADVSKVFTADGEHRDNAVSELQQHVALLKERAGLIHTTHLNSDAQKALEHESDSLSKYLAELDSLVAARDNPSAAVNQFGTFLQTYQDLRGEMDAMADTLQAEVKQTSDRSNAVVYHSKLAIAGVCFASSAILIFFAITIIRAINRPLAAVVLRLQALAQGDLTQRVDATRRDEIGELGHWFNQSAENLNRVILQVRQAADEVLAAAGEMSSGAREQASGAELQRSQADEVTHAMGEMSSRVTVVTEHARQASDAAVRTADTARRGGEVVKSASDSIHAISTAVQQTSATIKELGQSSRQIGEIVGVIDEIAEQANLLALNAAIEAARAGEHGRGFAVVADEVHKLAERTSHATSEIARTITTVQKETEKAVRAAETALQQVGQGVEATSRASVSLKDIIQMADEVQEKINQIVGASEEQSGVAMQASSNVDQIAHISRSSAEGSVKVAERCDHLTLLAQNLEELITQFVVAEDDESAPPHPEAQDYDRAPTEGSGMQPRKAAAASA